MFYYINLFIILLCSGNIFQTNKSNISLQITNCIPNKGNILVAVYSNEKGFPGNDKLCFKSFQVKATGTETSVVILTDIPYGKYGISVFQDENKDGKLNTNFMGIPKEGYGFSNNAHNPFGPPDFNDCIFAHQGETNISIKLKRW